MASYTKQKQFKETWAILDAAGSPVSQGSATRNYDMLTKTWTLTTRRIRPELLQLDPTSRSVGRTFMDPGYIAFKTAPYLPLYRTDSFTGSVADSAVGAYNYFRDIGNHFKAVSTAVSGLQDPRRRVELEQLADLDVLANLKDQKMNVLTTFAEGRKTLEWIAGRAASAVSAARAIKKGDVKSFLKQTQRSVPPPPRFLKKKGFKGKAYEVVPQTPAEVKEGFKRPFAERWLEYNYAVIPTMLDLNGAADLLTDWYENLPLTLPVKVEGRASGYFEYPDIWRNLGKGLSTSSVKPRVRLTAHGWEGSKVVLWYNITRKTLKQFANLGVINVPETALELVPYSFVAEWSATFQGYLHALDAHLGTQFVAGYRLEFCNLQVRCEVEPNGATIVELREPAGVALCVNRKKLTGYPTPVVVVKSPLSGAHIATTAAILATASRYR